MTNSLVKSPEPSTSASLLLRASEGHSQAWHTIVQLYGPIVYAWMRRSGYQSADAADIMQETLAAAATRIGTFDSERAGATFRGWLWTIARNKAVDLIRRQSKEPQAAGGTVAAQKLKEIAEPPDSESQQRPLLLPADPPSDVHGDRSSVIRRALADMRSRFRKQTWLIFEATTIDNRSVDDVAAEFQVSKWTVYKARSRVLTQLREYLTGLEKF